MVKVIEPQLASGEQLVVFGKTQDEYFDLPAAVDQMGTITTEWEFSAEDLEKILDGGRLRLRILTFGQPLQPVCVEVIK